MQPAIVRAGSKVFVGTFGQGFQVSPRETDEQHFVAHPEETIGHLLNRAALLRVKGEKSQAEELERKAKKLCDRMDC